MIWSDSLHFWNCSRPDGHARLGLRKTLWFGFTRGKLRLWYFWRKLFQQWVTPLGTTHAYITLFIFYLSFWFLLADKQFIVPLPQYDITDILIQGISIALSSKTSENFPGYQIMTRVIKKLINFNCSSQLHKNFLCHMLQSKRYFTIYQF